jgi:hypothetical protein
MLTLSPKSSNCGLIFRRIEALTDEFGTNKSWKTYNHNSGRARGKKAGDGTSEKSTEATVKGSVQDPDDGNFIPSENESHDEISEYKRIRLLDSSRMVWDRLACAQELRISSSGLLVSFPGHGASSDSDAYVVARATKPTRSATNGQSFARIYFEVQILRGDVCVGFRTDSTPTIALPGAKGLYAYYSQKGKVFTGSPFPHITGSALGKDHVVGCGIHGQSGYFCFSKRLIRKFTARATASRGA